MISIKYSMTFQIVHCLLHSDFNYNLQGFLVWYGIWYQEKFQIYYTTELRKLWFWLIYSIKPFSAIAIDIRWEYTLWKDFLCMMWDQVSLLCYAIATGCMSNNLNMNRIVEELLREDGNIVYFKHLLSGGAICSLEAF